MRRTSVWLLAGVVILAGCWNEKGAGPSTSAYKAARPKILAQAKEAAKSGVAAHPAAAAPAPTALPAAAPSQATVTTEYTYDPTEKRDPFRSFVLDQAKQKAEQEVGPLQQFDLSQLKVVAVVWDTGAPKALVADPSGRPYIIGEGTAVGKNEGRVIRIHDNLVLVKEIYVDWLGETTTKDIEMHLHRGEKGGKSR